MIKKFKKNRTFLLLAIPGTIWLIFFFYIPALANIVAFKNFKFHGTGFVDSLLKSEWVMFDNFKFLFTSKTTLRVIRNTLGYNMAFIIIGPIVAVGVALIINEIRSKRSRKVYQTMMLLPYFLSWVIISFFVYSFLSPDRGLFNSIIVNSGGTPISWYTQPKYWPFILVFMGIWKSIGYNSVLYFANIVGFDKSYYEAASMDGASKWTQAMKITVPLLRPLITIMTLLAIGNIFRADFGLFYQVPRNSGLLYDVTSVLDTFIYNGLTASGDIGMSTAAGLFQSSVGLVLIVLSNLVVKKIDPESALF